VSASEVRLAQRRWLLPGALGVLVVGVLAGTALAALGLPFSSGATAAPARPAQSPLPGQVTGPSSLPERSAAPGPSADAPGVPVMPPVGTLYAAASQCLDVDNPGNGAWALAADCAGPDQQRWQLARGTSDQYVITNAATGKCLAVENASRDDGARVVQADCRDGAEQRWLVRWQTDTFKLANVNSGMCAAVESAGRLRQRACGADDSQRWSVRA
jgi:hypothetical protein